MSKVKAKDPIQLPRVTQEEFEMLLGLLQPTHKTGGGSAAYSLYRKIQYRATIDQADPLQPMTINQDNVDKWAKHTICTVLEELRDQVADD